MSSRINQGRTRVASTPCKVCGMCEYGYGCEGTQPEKRDPQCFYRLTDEEDALDEAHA